MKYKFTMDLKLFTLFCLISLINCSPTFKKEEENFFKEVSSDDFYDYDEEIDHSEENEEDKFRLNDKHLKFILPNRNEKQADEQTETPEAKYEVTEIVDDIPNNTTVTGPVITNFTIAIPINNGTITNVTDIDYATDNNGNKGSPTVKRNYISIFHIKAEYDNDKPDITVIQNNRPHFPGFKGFQDYLKGVRQGIVNGIQNFFNNNNSNNNAQIPNNGPNNDVPTVHNIVNAPVVFWNRLQGKNSITGRQNLGRSKFNDVQ